MSQTPSPPRLHELVTGSLGNSIPRQTRRPAALIALLAWIGLGADGLTSSIYGPQQAFRALGVHAGLAPFLAIATALTVFIIALSYNQVIELFPTGGGGYKVAVRLLGPRAGLACGSALLMDYVLTIAISLAAGIDALFSLLPPSWIGYEPAACALALVVLVTLNLRGVQGSVKTLLLVFLGFVLTHAFLIVYGVASQADQLGRVLHASVAQFSFPSGQIGVVAVIALLIRAYALGGGTYTGIEAVSNSVNLLKEPRVRTGKWTMFYMAVSLSFTAGGIILLYLLWGARPVEGQTLNAVVFSTILSGWQWGGINFGHAALVLTLVLEAALLFVAANTGYLGGPAVLANMAVDHWLPHRFAQLSDRLVTKNGILLMGIAALAVLLWTDGRVDLLVVLYSINVFLTFSLTLLGLCVYWWRNRGVEPGWAWRLGLTLLGLSTTSVILVVTLVQRFHEGGRTAALVTGMLAALFWLVHRHYRRVHLQLNELDRVLAEIPVLPAQQTPLLREGEPAAVFFVSNYRGVGIHTLLNVQRLFPGRFRNFVFLSAGEVETAHMKGDNAISDLQARVDEALQKYVGFCNSHGLAAAGYGAYGTDPVEAAVKLADQALRRFPGSVFFAGTLVFREENWFTRILHNHTALAIQRQLHLKGMPLVIMPMLVDNRI